MGWKYKIPFFWKDPAEKISMGNIVILLSINMNNLTGLWIISVRLIPQ